MNHSSEIATHEHVRERWDANAEFWDERMGEGNAVHKQLIEPAVLYLLELQPGAAVLEVACGNVTGLEIENTSKAVAENN